MSPGHCAWISLSGSGALALAAGVDERAAHGRDEADDSGRPADECQLDLKEVLTEHEACPDEGERYRPASPR